MPSLPPPPPPAVLLRALGEWRRDRRAAVATAVLVVGLGAVLAVVAGSASATGEGPGLRELVTGAATAAAVAGVCLTFLAHVAVARTRWFRHVARSPRLLLEALRIPDAGGRLLAGVGAGLVAATFLHPVLGLALAGLALGILPTDVGRVLVSWRAAGATTRARVAARGGPVDPARWRLTGLALALGAVPVAVLRLVVLERDCVLDRVLGAGCPDGAVATTAAAIAVAIGAVAVTPLALGLGDVIARTLEGQTLGAAPPDLPSHVDVVDSVPEDAAVPQARADEPDVVRADEPDDVAEVPALWPDARPVVTELEPEPRPEPGPEAEPGPAPVVPDRVDAAVELARPSLEALSPATRALAVSLFASLSGGMVDSDGDAVEELRRSLHAASPDAIRSTLSLVLANAGRLEALRGQYQRSPRIARGAIERAASVGFRAAGVPGEHAESLADTLLQLDEEDWTHLADALEALDDELGGPLTGDGGRPTGRPLARDRLGRSDGTQVHPTEETIVAEGASPDELEQRQQLDGSLDEPTSIAGEDGPLDPDELEQRRRADGSVDLDASREEAGASLTPDELEQRQLVEDDGSDDHPPA